MLNQTTVMCATCFHAEADHHATMEDCHHRTGDAQCVCEAFKALENVYASA